MIYLVSVARGGKIVKQVNYAVSVSLSIIFLLPHSLVYCLRCVILRVWKKKIFEEIQEIVGVSCV